MGLFIPQGFKVAYVVFTHPSAVKAAMSVPADTVLVASSSPEEPVLTGVKSESLSCFLSLFVALDSLSWSPLLV